MPRYVPARGEIVWLEFHPQTGREQAGRRPALVLSAESYNRKSGLAVLCPVTSQRKGYPFEVPLPPGGRIEGVVLSDQVRSLDWRTRKAARIERAPAASVREVVAKIQALLAPA